MSESCGAPRRRRVSEGPFCSVDACGCGTLHVSIGAVTLRLEPEVAESIWNVLGQGLAELNRGRDGDVPRHMETFLRSAARGGTRPS